MTFPDDPTRIFESAAACATQRLAQISRLAQLQNERSDEFSATGLTLVRRAIFAMMLDRRQAGLNSEAIRIALNGDGSVSADASPDFPRAA